MSHKRAQKVMMRLKKYCYRCRVQKYLAAKSRHIFLKKYLEKMKERTMEVQSESIKHQLVDNHWSTSLTGKAFGVLKNYAIYQIYKKQNLLKAQQFEVYRKMNVSFSLIKFYSEHRRMKSSLYQKAIYDRSQK